MDLLISLDQKNNINKKCIYKAIEFYKNNFDFLNTKINFQYKIFQKYLEYLEDSMPFYIKSKKISSLFDLNIFHSLDTFDSEIKNFEIKNLSTKVFISNKFQHLFIGKLLNVISNNKSIIDDIKEYSFTKIYTSSYTNVPVRVIHLALIPHYQMGVMNSINKMILNIRKCK